MKECGHCKQLKQFSCFYKDKHKKSGYTSHCKECISSYKNKNKDKIKEYVQKYEAKNACKIASRKRNYYLINKEIINARNKEFRDINKAKCNAYTRKYQAAKLKRTPKWLLEQDHKVIESNYAIALWLSDVVGIPYHVDHIIPLQGKNVSGLHIPSNLRIIRGEENLRKGNKYVC